MPNKQKATVFIDQSNLHYALNWRIDFKKFRGHLSISYDIVKAYFYDGKRPLGYYEKKQPHLSFEERIAKVKAKTDFFKRMKSKGFVVRTKWVKSVYDNTEGKYKSKCNFDVELTIDAIDTADSYEVAIIVSGDGDYLKLIKYLKSKYKKVHVIAPKNHCDLNLKKAAHKFEFINGLRKEIELK